MIIGRHQCGKNALVLKEHFKAKRIIDENNHASIAEFQNGDLVFCKNAGPLIKKVGHNRLNVYKWSEVEKLVSNLTDGDL